MVVTFCISIRRRVRSVRRSPPCATVLLAGIAVLPTQSGSISLLPPGEQLRAIEGLRTGPQINAIAAPPYGNFAPPTGVPDPALAFAFDWNLAGLPEAQGSDSAITALINGTVSSPSDESGVVAGPVTGFVPAVSATDLGGFQIRCGQLTHMLESGGEYWNTQTVGGPAAQFFVKAPADPTQGPSGDPSNLYWPNSAGEWCRPLPLPFAESGPLASRIFWTPILLLLVGVAVLWLSRGVRLPT